MGNSKVQRAHDLKSIIPTTKSLASNHCYKEANQTADFLSKMGSLQQEAFVYYITPPLFMLDVLFFDSTCSSTSNVTTITETSVTVETTPSRVSFNRLVI